MKNKEFDTIEHEIIYKKLVKYYEENNNKNIERNCKSYNSNLNIYNSNSSIDKMKEYKDLYAHRLIKSHRKYIGNTIIFGKKIVRRLLKWYINPITQDQTIFNNATVSAIEDLSNEFNKNLLEQENKTNKIYELENELNKIYELENKINKIYKLEKEINRITELEKSVAKIKSLEEREQISDKIRKLDDILSLNLQEETGFFEKVSYSQSGEDTIVAYILYCLGIKNEEITYLDLGANHAKEISNTYYFYKNGAKGVLVDANPKLIQELAFYRHRDTVLNCIISENESEEVDFYILSGDGLSTPDKEQALEVCKINTNIHIDSIIKVKSNTVNNIIARYFGGITPTFISLDIEGHDLQVIESIDFDRYRPIIFIVETIEYRPYLPINVKNERVVDYLKSKDYVEYAFTGINSIFIDAKYMRSLGQEG